MSETIEVFPKAGEWYWKHKGESKKSKKFETRSEAFEDALLERDTEGIVLLRQNGKVHSELYHESRPGSNVQHVDILAATDRNGAGELDNG